MSDSVFFTPSRRTLLKFGGVVAGGIALAACSSSKTADKPSNTAPILTIATLVQPTSWDPAQAQEGHFMQFYQAVYDSLLRRLPNGDLAPMLATAYTYNDSGTELTLKLRADVTFSDGAKFDAKAVKANMEHFKSSTGPQATTLKAVDSINVVDDTTVKLQLSAPDPSLLIYLSNAAGLMASPDVLHAESLATKPVGSGPYTLDAANTAVDSQYTFLAKSGYWSPELQLFSKVVMRPMTDTTARLNALLTNQVDAAQLDPKTAPRAISAGFKLNLIKDSGFRGLFLLDRKGELVPALGDVRVRQAINYAIDGTALLNQLALGFGTPSQQIFGSSTEAYKPALNAAYPFNPAKARQLLADAGYAKGFTIQIGVSNSNQAENAVIKQQLGDVGITVQYVDVPASKNIAELTSGKYPVILFQLAQFNVWTQITSTLSSDALWNPRHSTDATAEKLITGIRTQADKAPGLSQELNQYITDQAWFNVWYSADRLYMTNSKVAVTPQVAQAAPSIYNYSLFK